MPRWTTPRVPVVRTTLELPAELHERLVARAQADATTLKAVLVAAITAYLEGE